MKKITWNLAMTSKYRPGNNLFMQLFRENDHQWELIILVISDAITVYTKSILGSV